MNNKYLIWLLLGFVVFIYWKIYSSRSRNQQNQQHRDSKAAPQSAQKNLAQDVEPCAWCGVYLPRSEGFTHKGASSTDPMWCSTEHLALGVKAKSRWWKR